MKLVQITNSCYNEINHNLRLLIMLDIVVQQRLGHKHIIKLNLENEKTLRLIQILEILDDLKDLDQLQKNY